MKNSILIVVLILSVQTAVFSQIDSWIVGNVKLNNGASLDSVLIKYNFKANILQVKNEYSMQVYNAKQIAYFDYTDIKKGVRKFYSKSYAIHHKNYKTPVFFELVHEGNHISLLIREYLKYERKPVFDHSQGRVVMKKQSYLFHHLYFKYHNNGIIEQFDENQISLLDLLPGKEKELKSFIAQHKLSLSNIKDVIKVLNYYEEIASKEEELAGEPVQYYLD